MTNYSIKQKPPKRIGFAYAKLEENYIWSRFVKELVRTISILDRTNQESSEEVTPAYFKRIIVFENGLLAYEPSNTVFAGEIFEAIIDAWKIQKKVEEPDIVIQKIDLDYKILKLFYHEAKSVEALELKKIGEVAPNPHMPEEMLRSLVVDTGKSTEKMQLSGKLTNYRTSGNLKEAELVDRGLMPISEPQQVKGTDIENYKFTIGINGHITTYLPEDPEKQKSKIVNIVKKISSMIEKNPKSPA